MAEKMPKVKEKQPQPCGQIIVYNEFNEEWAQVFDEIDFLSSLLTGPEAKEIVIFGEDNFTFDIALATARNNSWEGISYGVRHVFKFQEKKLKCIELCSQMGRQQRLSEIEIMSRMADMLKTPTPPSTVRGKVVWYQYPQTKNGPAIKEVIEEIKDQQQKGDYLLFGRLSSLGRPYSNTSSYYGTIDCSPDYSFLGADRNFVNKLISYGYCDHECSNFEHLTFVLKRSSLMLVMHSN
uniref:Uncharacterized protein n=1 Tax=Amphimedon queenslandica TaxID=400682 RepID=A0A1X7U5L3_AMPQE